MKINRFAVSIIAFGMSVVAVTAQATDYYVDGVNGDDAADGLSPASAFKTLDKGFASAYSANIAAGTNGQGNSLGSSTVTMVAGAGPYTLPGARNVEGEIALVGGGGVADVESTGANAHLYVAGRYNNHATSPNNGALTLQGVDWLKTTSGALCVGYNTGYAGPIEGVLSILGGSFVYEQTADAHIGSYTANNSTDAPVEGQFSIGAGTAPVSLAFGNLNVGYRVQAVSTAVGLIDFRANAGGTMSVGTALRTGMNGKPSVGGILLGTNWTLNVGSGSGTVAIGQGGNSVVSTGRVSFAKGGAFNAALTDFAVGYGNGNSTGETHGELLGGEGTSVDVVTKTFRVGSSPGNGKASGIVDFTASDGGALSATASFSVGFRNSLGEVRLGENWDVQIGSPSAPVKQMDVGYGDGKSATGLVSVASGCFAAYATNLWMTYGKSPSASATIQTGASDFTLWAQNAYVGHDQDGRQVRGEIDASASTNASVVLGTLRMGYASSGSPSFFGRLALGRGAGTVESLYMGVGADPVEGLRCSRLVLSGFEMGVATRLEIRRSGQIQVGVAGKSAGPAIASTASLVFTDTRTTASGPGVDIVFSALPEGMRRASVLNHDAILWGFKWEGDRVADIGTLIADGKVAYDTSALDAATADATGVFHDAATDATYIGLYVRTAQDPLLVIVR